MDCLSLVLPSTYAAEYPLHGRHPLEPAWIVQFECQEGAWDMMFSIQTSQSKDHAMIYRIPQSLFGRCTLVAIALLCMEAGPAAQSRDAKDSPDKAMQPVLIIHADCTSEAKIGMTPGAACETVIPEEKFDNLIAALDPRMPASNRLVLAAEYVKLLVMSREAERLKIDEDPAFRELEQFTRLQLLERQLVRYLEKQSAAISPAEIAEYYQQHQSRFEEGSLRKIFIPKEGPWSTTDAVQTIQQRAAKGEDFDALEREVWAKQGRTAGAPLTRTGTLRRSALPEVEQKVFDLKPGEVSMPIEEAGGFSIFKVEAKRVLPPSSVEAEIRNGLAGERLQERIKNLRSAVSVSVNEDYFGALPSMDELMKHHGMEHSGSHLMPMSDEEKKRR